MNGQLYQLNQQLADTRNRIKSLETECIELRRLIHLAEELQYRAPDVEVNQKNAEKYEWFVHTHRVLTELQDLQKQNSTTDRDLIGMSTGDILKYLRMSSGAQLKYSTLRSYLNRYQKEGRLVYNKQCRLWSLPHVEKGEP